MELSRSDSEAHESQQPINAVVPVCPPPPPTPPKSSSTTTTTFNVGADEKEKEKECNPGGGRTNNAMLEGIQSFAKNSLRPTTTVVYGMPVVAGKPQPFNVTSAPTDEEVIEYHDAEEEIQKKAIEFARIIKNAKHFVVYTGAGISTAAKIPDYRGPQGVWTLQAKGLAARIPITLEQALPTYSHMALVALMKKGFLKYVVSTNVDGLHRRSGIPAESIAELHGNVYREVCSNAECGKEYLRNFDVTKNRRQRFTGRLCNVCGSKLMDSIINFGENLPKQTLADATTQSTTADVTLVIGSSMRVAPACHLPAKSYVKGGSFSICNLQKTIFDRYTEKGGLRIFAESDDFLRRVMAELAIEVEEYRGEGDEEIATQMQEMLFDESFNSTAAPFPGMRISLSMADDAIPAEVLDQILLGMFNLHPISVQPSQRK